MAKERRSFAEEVEKEKAKQRACLEGRNKALIQMRDLTDKVEEITKKLKANAKETADLNEAKRTALRY